MILIISDFHGKYERVLELIEKYKPKFVLSLGDGEVDKSFYLKYNIITVKGNCDYCDLKDIEFFKHDNLNMILTHGDKYGVYFGLDRLRYLALENNANVILYGHTHKQSLVECEGITYLNPGALKDGHYAIYTDKKFILK